jgi:hypothetical protein
MYQCLCFLNLLQGVNRVTCMNYANSLELELGGVYHRIKMCVKELFYNNLMNI